MLLFWLATNVYNEPSEFEEKSIHMGIPLSISSILSQSEVNGPGERLVVWTQGCSKACPGCFNPETWKFSRKNLWESTELAEKVFSSSPDGLTLTGGDPLEQPEALLEFLAAQIGRAHV